MTNHQDPPGVADTLEFLQGAIAHGLTHEGAQWVLKALDTNHATEMPDSRMPNDRLGQSIVYNRQKTLQVGAPSFLAANETWDCNIAFLPVTQGEFTTQLFDGVVSSTTANGGTSFANVNNYQNSTGVLPNPNEMPADNVVICKVRSGDKTFDVGVPANGGADREFQSISNNTILNAQNNGPCHYISAALKIENTTAPLNKQGNVVMYRITTNPQEGNYECYDKNGAAFNYIKKDRFVSCQLPPQTSAQASATGGVPGRAAEGAFLPIIMNAEENVATRPQLANLVYINDADPPAGWGFTSGATRSCFVGPATNGGDGNPTGVPAPVHVSAMNTSGAYFTGLSPETTLFVTFTYQIECYPPANDDLIELASMSAPLDEEALQLYNTLAHRLRPGYPAHYNFMGLSFKMLGKRLKQILRGAKKAVPTVKAIAKAIPLGAEVIDRVEDTVKAGKAVGHAMGL